MAGVRGPFAGASAGSFGIGDVSTLSDDSATGFISSPWSSNPSIGFRSGALASVADVTGSLAKVSTGGSGKAAAGNAGKSSITNQSRSDPSNGCQLAANESSGAIAVAGFSG